MQKAIFDILNISKDEAESKFGFLLKKTYELIKKMLIKA